MASIYYNPEECGLTIVDEIGYSDYDWSLLVVWKDKDNRLYYGTDSGCSCNSPWEENSTTECLTEINDSTWDSFRGDVRNYYYGDLGEKDRLLRKVRDARRKVRQVP